MPQRIFINANSIEEAKKLAIEKFKKTEQELNLTIFRENPPTIFIEADISDIKDEVYKISSEFFEKVFEFYSITGKVFEPQINDNYFIVKIETSNDQLFAKNNASILLTLQELLNLVGKKQFGFEPRIILDCKDYRVHRNNFLKSVALKKAEEVKRTRRTFIFYPLDSYERKIIHMTLQNDPDVMTESEGNSKYKRVRIMLKSNNKNIKK
ncbi:MAG TPA: R3H domain-containing nucleic acid-binding protein [Exilispira sp.]|nr:R3H domain-containing nucleic acid-binding protein [Exilispira sp.]